jgi:hypothetical protein
LALFPFTKPTDFYAPCPLFITYFKSPFFLFSTFHIASSFLFLL